MIKKGGWESVFSYLLRIRLLKIKEMRH